MRIVHLNTHSYGGAAVVARRLHCASLACGVDSHFITQYGLRSDATPRYTALRDARVLYLLRRKSADPRLYRLGKFLQRWAQHKNLANRPAGLEVFSPLNTRPKFSDCTQAHDPDVIHLHWVNGFLDHEEFFRRNRDRKFVWTLHDMNPLTGGCHHSDGCLGYTSGCKACPQLAGTIDPDYSARVLAAKQQMLRHLDDEQLTIVTPSRWLMDLSLQSPVTGRFRHVHIENPSLNAQTSDEEPAALRQQLGLPGDRKIVLFAADNLRNPRKGFDLLFAAVALLDDPANVHLVGLGQRTDAPAGASASFPGPISEERTLVRYFRSADVVVSPSVAENAPLIIIEALSCGTPVVAFKVGGVPELVTAESGVLAETRTPARLAAALQEALYGRVFSRPAIRAAGARFAPARVFDKYQAVYHDLLAHNHAVS